jgi:general secretion pathway protein L
MAHKILGIDLGAWSVKVAELEAGFRVTKLIGLYEKPLLPREEGETDLARAARTLGELIAEHKLEPEMCATTLGGEATIRLIRLPLADPKKIDQVLGYELESQILGDLEGLVWDSVIAGQSAPGQTDVIAVAAPREEVRALVDALAAVNAEPRVVGAAALSYAALRGRAFVADDAAPQLVLDFGHRHTHACVVAGGRVAFARHIPRGGEDVTRALGEAFKMSELDAEGAKHRQAFVLAPGQVAETPSHRRVDECVREALRPLIRELRQTLAAYRAGGGAAPERVLMTGGAARLRGLREYLEVELGLPLAPLALDAADPFVAPTLQGHASLVDELPAQALGMALAAAAPVPQVNLRKGDLAYRSDYSYLRGKAGYLAAAILAVLMFAAVNAAASLRGLRKEADALEARLKRDTAELFGQPRTDARQVSEELRKGPHAEGAPQIPQLSAYDVLDEISRHVPPADKVKLDITELDIKPKKVFLRGTAESAAQVDDLAASLEKIECFEKVEKGKISSVTARPSGDNPKDDKAQELKQFTLNINTTCP